MSADSSPNARPPGDSAEWISRAEARAERDAARKDARRSQMITLTVALVGVLGTLLGTYWSGANQRSAARDEFLRNERRTAYVNFTTAVFAYSLADSRYLKRWEGREDLNVHDALRAAKDLDRTTGKQSEDLRRALAVVQIVGGDEYLDAAGDCYAAQRVQEDAMFATLFYGKAHEKDLGDARNRTHEACEPLGDLARKDLNR